MIILLIITSIEHSSSILNSINDFLQIQIQKILQIITKFSWISYVSKVLNSNLKVSTYFFFFFFLFSYLTLRRYFYRPRKKSRLERINLAWKKHVIKKRGIRRIQKCIELNFKSIISAINYCVKYRFIKNETKIC